MKPRVWMAVTHVAVVGFVLGVITYSGPAWSQSLSLDLGQGGQAGTTSRLIQLTVAMGVLSLAPSLLVMMTAFTRIVIVLSLLRSGIGAQGTPPNTVIIGLSLFLTFFVMQPVLEQAWSAGLLPMARGETTDLEGLRLTAEPFHKFMVLNVRPADLSLILPRSSPRLRPLPCHGGRLYQPSWLANSAGLSRWDSCCSCPS
jgi:flagellar biosynthesis protein FliP